MFVWNALTDNKIDGQTHHEETVVLKECFSVPIWKLELSTLGLANVAQNERVTFKLPIFSSPSKMQIYLSAQFEKLKVEFWLLSILIWKETYFLFVLQVKDGISVAEGNRK